LTIYPLNSQPLWAFNPDSALEGRYEGLKCKKSEAYIRNS